MRVLEVLEFDPIPLLHLQNQVFSVIGYESAGGFRVGYTYYNDIGNLKDADFGMLYIGTKF